MTGKRIMDQRAIAEEACAKHAEEINLLLQEHDGVLSEKRKREAERHALNKQLIGTIAFAVVGHALIQSECDRLLAQYLPLPFPWNQLLLGVILLGAFWITGALAAAPSPSVRMPDADDDGPWWKQPQHFPAFTYVLALLSLVAMAAMSLQGGMMGILLSIVGLCVACAAWYKSIQNRVAISKLQVEIRELAELRHTERELATIAKRYANHFKMGPDAVKLVQRKIEHGMPLHVFMWVSKIMLAVLVAYPGHIAMGELIGYSANYSLGFKAYLVTWPIVGVLLLAAELLIIYGVVERRLARDAYKYLYHGYDIRHYNRLYSFRPYDSESHDKLTIARNFQIAATILALVDLAFNIFYIYDATGSFGLSLLAGTFFTALLVGLAVLIGHTYEYEHRQLKDTLKENEGTQANRRRSSPSQPARPIAPQPMATPPSGPKNPRTAKLVTLSGKNATFPLSPEGNTIGRIGHGNVVELDDRSVSRSHAAISWNGTEWVVEDRASSFGTFVDGQRLQNGERLILRPGNQIKFGEVALRFER